MKYKKLAFRMIGPVCALLSAATSVDAQEIPGEESAPAPQAEKRFITEKVNLGNQTAVPYLVYVGRSLTGEQPAPVVIFLTDSATTMQKMQETWTLDAKQTLDRFITVVPSLPVSELFRTRGSAFIETLVDDVTRKFKADTQRIHLWGARRGGRLAYHLVRGMPDRFAGLVVQFGWDPFVVDLMEFRDMNPAAQNRIIRDYPLTYIPNITHLGVINITGTFDAGMGTALLAGQALNREGGSCRTLWLESDPTTEHELWFPSRTTADMLLSQTSEPFTARERIVFRADRLRYNQSAWVTLHDFRTWYEMADVDIGYAADRKGELICKTHNVRTLEIRPPRPAHHIRIDGDPVACEAQGATFLQYDKGHWEPVSPVAVIVTEKYPDRAGPMDDAFAKPYIFVYGTRGIYPAELKEWAIRTAAEPLFSREDMFGNLQQVRIISDQVALKDKAVLENHNLICFGGPIENEVSKLCERKKDPKILRTFENTPSVYAYAHPSPFSISHYAVVQTPLAKEAMQKPAELNWRSDWVVYRPGDGARAAGFFDKTWALQDPPESE